MGCVAPVAFRVEHRVVSACNQRVEHQLRALVGNDELGVIGASDPHAGSDVRRAARCDRTPDRLGGLSATARNGDIDDGEGESPEQDAESGVDLEDEDVDSLPAVDGAAVDESQGEDVALSEAEPDTEDDKKDSSAEASASETGDTSASGDTAASRDDSGSGDDSAGE